MPQAGHQRVATFRLLDVPALAHELRFPIDLWRKSWTSDGGGEGCGGKWTFGDLSWSVSSWGTTVTPIEQPNSSRTSSFPLHSSPSEAETIPQFGIGSETLGSCCSSQTRGSTHLSPPFLPPITHQPATTTRALTQGQNNGCHQVGGELRRRQRGRWWPPAARRCILWLQ